MKRIISVVLSFAMLMTLLSITASAAAITSISVEFDPRVGADVPLSASAIRNQGTTSSSVPCVIEYMFTGDAIAAFTSAKIDSQDDIKAFCTVHSPLGDGAVYEAKEYLFVFCVYVGGDTVIAPTIATTDNAMPGHQLFIEDEVLYFYFIFTPQAAAGNNNTNTNVGGNNSGTSTGSSSTLNSKTSQDIDVKATYNSSGDETIIYSVVIEWGSMEFTYNSEFVGTWNPETHDYGGQKDAYWSYEAGANAITVTNHSNAEIQAGFTYNQAIGFSDVTGKFYVDSNEINTAQPISSAVNIDLSAPPTLTAHLELNGDLPESAASGVTCGVVTVTIS